MNVEHPAALRFILQDDIYLLKQDKPLYEQTGEAIATEEATAAEEKPVEVTPEAPLSFNFMGSNTGGLTILVHYADQEHIAPAHLTALEAILGRKGIAINDAAIVNIAKQGNNVEDIVAFFNPVKLLVLGEKAIPEQLATAQLNTIGIHQGVNILYSFSFDEMMDNNANKKLFWEQMKLL